MKPSEVIDKAITEVMPDEGRWMQGDLSNFSCDDPKHCMAGALQRAVGIIEGNVSNFERNGVEHQAYLAARLAIIEAIEAQYCNDQWFFTLGITLPRFNDADGRTYDEVREVMEKAKCALQERGE